MSMKEEDKILTHKQEIFCLEYIIDLNQSQAAIRAGYSKNSANVTACKMLTKANIQKRIQELMTERSQKTQITSEMVLNELALIAFSDIASYYDEKGKLKPLKDIKNTRSISEIRQTKAKDGSVTTIFKVYDKVKGLELLGRNLVLFTDKVQHEGEVEVNTNVTVLNINHRKKGEKIVKDAESE